eukprot:SAG22_NODE_793_length_7164_cov_30.556043_3_plen_122_part_00
MEDPALAWGEDVQAASDPPPPQTRRSAAAAAAAPPSPAAGSSRTASRAGLGSGATRNRCDCGAGRREWCAELGQPALFCGSCAPPNAVALRTGKARQRPMLKKIADGQLPELEPNSTCLGC